MTTNHIDQLAQWWETAKEGVINEGDRLIYRDGEDYDFRTAAREDAGTSAEKEHEHGWGILARAPKPKPAWHDAPAVTATYRDDCGMVSGVWTPSGNHGYWIGPEDDVVTHDSLEDVTPLIEAKVTGDMIDRIEHHFISTQGAALPVGFARRLLHIALNLDPA